MPRFKNFNFSGGPQEGQKTPLSGNQGLAQFALSALRVLSVMFLIFTFILNLPFSYDSVSFLKGIVFILPFLLPFSFFLLLLVFGVEGFANGKFVFKKSMLTTGVFLFCLYFLIYIPFMNRNLFSYTALNPLFYVLAPLSFFFLQKAFSSSPKIARLSLVSVFVVAVIIFLLTNTTLNSFYTNTLKINISKITVLSLPDSWKIAVESIKNKPLFGVGPGNFDYAFTQYKPLAFNAGTNWSLRFENSGNFFFQILTVSGLVGFLMLLVLFFGVGQMLLRDKKLKRDIAAGVVFLLMMFLMPFSYALLFFFFAFLAAFSANTESEEMPISARTNVYAIAGLSLVLFLLGGFFTTKLTSANYHYQKAQTAKMNNDAKETYDALIQAIKLNPQSDLYHRDYAQVNLLIANSLAAKENLTDEEKTQAQQLLSQAVRESQIITQQTNPYSAVNWEIRGLIYRSLIGGVEEADQWAKGAYLQAIQLDPLNPLLKVDLGGIYYQLKDYSNATIVFQDAIRVKGDYANAYYNLAHTLKMQNDTKNAIVYLTQAVNLTEKENQSYKTAKDELDAWKKESGSGTNNQNQNNQTPQESTGSAN